MLDGIEVRTNTDFFNNKEGYEQIANKVIFTGRIDEFYNYCYGELKYRSLRFEHEILNVENFQGNAVVNYTEYEVPYTRIIENKHFEFGNQPQTVITKEYPAKWNKGVEPYYPVNNEINDSIYSKYKDLADKEKNVIFGGRLAEYKYYDMHNIVEIALKKIEEEIQ